jgi:hypothetical protein
MVAGAGDFEIRGNSVINSAWPWTGNTFDSRPLGPAIMAPNAAEPCARAVSTRAFHTILPAIGRHKRPFFRRVSGPKRFFEFVSVLDVAGEALLKLVPVSIALGAVFALLEQWSACNPGRPCWNKRQIVTNVAYRLMIPLMARCVRTNLQRSAPGSSSFMAKTSSPDRWAVQILVLEPGLSPLASRASRSRWQPQRGSCAPDLRPVVRHLLYGGGRARDSERVGHRLDWRWEPVFGKDRTQGRSG